MGKGAVRLTRINKEFDVPLSSSRPRIPSSGDRNAVGRHAKCRRDRREASGKLRPSTSLMVDTLSES